MTKDRDPHEEMLALVETRLKNILFDSKWRMRDRGDYLLKAYSLTMSERNHENGDPVEQMDSVAGLWQQFVNEANCDVSQRQQVGYMNVPSGIKITAADACMMMVLLKVSRYLMGKQKDDDFIDICGYAAMAGQCSQERR